MEHFTNFQFQTFFFHYKFSFVIEIAAVRLGIISRVYRTVQVIAQFFLILAQHMFSANDGWIIDVLYLHTTVGQLQIMLLRLYSTGEIRVSKNKSKTIGNKRGDPNLKLSTIPICTSFSKRIKFS